MSKIPISVVIVAKNEEKRINDCIKSVIDWADEIILVDDESTDSTRNIAKDFGIKVLVCKMNIEGKHRNWAYSQAKNEWVFSLDADERPTLELKNEIAKTIKSTDCTHFSIPFKTYIGNYWIRWGGWYPGSKVKLFKKNKFKYEEVEVHPRIITEGKVGHLKSDVIHYSYRDFEDFVNKTNKQTTLEALKWYKLSKKNPKKAKYKMNMLHAIWRSIDRFFRTFLAKKGYRDGTIGFMVAYFSSFYQIVSFAKYKEIERQNKEKVSSEKR